MGNCISAISFCDIYFGSRKRALDIILDWRLFLIVVASTLTIASGYIINNFYDAKKI